MLKVELAVSGDVLSQRSFELAVPEIATMGFRGIELAEPKRLADPGELARLLNGYLMRVACYDFGTAPDGGDVEGTLHALQKTGANRVLVRAGPRMSARSLAQAVEALAEKALSVGLHPSACTAALGVEGTEEFCAAVGKETCGVAADAAALTRAGIDGREFIEKFSARIDYVRLADLAADGTPVALGAGRADVAGFVDALNAANYFGWLTVVSADFNSLRTSREFFQRKLGVYSRM